MNSQPRKLLITGAAGDLGLASARLALANGWQVVLHTRSEDSQSKLQDLLPNSPAKYVSGDLASDGMALRLVNESSELLGGLDSIVHFAGIQETRTLKSATEDFIRSMFEVNVLSSIMLLKAFRDKRIVKNAPSVVLISSIAAVVGHAGDTVYSASKGALLSLTKSSAVELAPQGIRVNCIIPGAIQGKMTDSIASRIGSEAFEVLKKAHPLGLGTPEDIAEAAFFLASERSKWTTGSQLIVDGGYTAS